MADLVNTLLTKTPYCKRLSHDIRSLGLFSICSACRPGTRSHLHPGYLDHFTTPYLGGGASAQPRPGDAANTRAVFEMHFESICGN